MRFLRTGCLVLASLLGASGLRAETGDPADKGRELAKANCGRCHAIGIDDKSPHEKAPPFRHVATLYPAEDLAEALAEGIVSGHPDMPVFVLKPPEIDAFLAYLKALDASAKAAGTSDR